MIAVLACLAAALGAFGWGAFKTWHAIAFLFESGGKDPLTAIKFIELMDAFLIATALLIFAIGLYELFVEDIAVPRGSSCTRSTISRPSWRASSSWCWR